MTNDEIKKIFDGFDPSDYGAEVAQRWGETDAFSQSTARAKNYSSADWAKMKAQQDQLENQFADAMGAGLAATDEAVLDLAEQHRAHINRWFYDCDHKMHGNLAEMYVADARFAAHYNAKADGLADFISSAINGNAERHDG